MGRHRPDASGGPTAGVHAGASCPSKRRPSISVSSAAGPPVAERKVTEQPPENALRSGSGLALLLVREYDNGVVARGHHVEAPVSIEIRDVEDLRQAAKRIDRPAVPARP